MLKTLLHGVFRAGRIPGAMRASLESEGIKLLEEGVWGNITYLNYRAPGRYSNWKRQWFLGAIALTSRRVIAYDWTRPLLDIPYDNPTFAAVNFTLESPERLCASFDVSKFHPDRSGKIKLRYTTPQAARILRTLQQRKGGEK